MVSEKAEFCLKKKKHTEHKYSVAFITKSVTKSTIEVLGANFLMNKDDFLLIHKSEKRTIWMLMIELSPEFQFKHLDKVESTILKPRFLH